MCDDKERLMKMLLLDMKHWSLDALKVALNYIDGQILSFASDDFLWWWELRKHISAEMEKRKVTHDVFAGKEI